MQPVDPSAAGRRSYRLMERLGQGGFGSVWRGQLVGASGFSKSVAIKVLSAEAEQVDEFVQRLRDEARILAMLRHRSIVQVDDLVTIDGRWAVVMEYIDGADLAEVLKLGPVPARAACGLGLEIAGALQAAHSAINPENGRPVHIVHRDIKPANIRLTHAGEVKILDFGVARGVFDEREAQTRSLAFGSLGYLAPERFDGEDTAAVDIYALGVILVEALTGRGMGQLSVRPKVHARSVEEAIERLEGFPEELSGLLRRMIAYDPGDRPDAGEVAKTLRNAQLVAEGDWLADWAPAALRSIVGNEIALPEAPEANSEATLDLLLTARARDDRREDEDDEAPAPMIPAGVLDDDDAFPIVESAIDPLADVLEAEGDAPGPLSAPTLAGPAQSAVDDLGSTWESDEAPLVGREGAPIAEGLAEEASEEVVGDAAWDGAVEDEGDAAGAVGAGAWDGGEGDSAVDDSATTDSPEAESAQGESDTAAAAAARADAEDTWGEMDEGLAAEIARATATRSDATRSDATRSDATRSDATRSEKAAAPAPDAALARAHSLVPAAATPEPGAARKPATAAPAPPVAEPAASGGGLKWVGLVALLLAVGAGGWALLGRGGAQETAPAETPAPEPRTEPEVALPVAPVKDEGAAEEGAQEGGDEEGADGEEGDEEGDEEGEDEQAEVQAAPQQPVAPARPVSTSGKVLVEGDHSAFWLVSFAGTIVSPDAVPPGSYTVHVMFDDGVEVTGPAVEVGIQQQISVRCSSVAQSCKVLGQ